MLLVGAPCGLDYYALGVFVLIAVPPLVTWIAYPLRQAQVGADSPNAGSSREDRLAFPRSPAARRVDVASWGWAASWLALGLYLH
jgi:hypothetical protein